MRYMVVFYNMDVSWVKFYYTLEYAYRLYDKMKSGYPRNTHVEIQDTVSKKTIAEYNY